MWDLIVLVSDHCLSVYLEIDLVVRYSALGRGQHLESEVLIYEASPHG